MICWIFTPDLVLIDSPFTVQYSFQFKRLYIYMNTFRVAISNHASFNFIFFEKSRLIAKESNNP